MAGNNRIDFTVGFNMDKSGLNTILKDLKGLEAEAAIDLGMNKQLQKAGETASKVGTILKNSFNIETGQINIGKFTQELSKAGISAQELGRQFTSAGSQGVAAFASLGRGILNTKVQIKETQSLLDQLATTMDNTVKWGITSSIFNSMTQSVRESLTYVEKLDKSLNDIMIVTNKSGGSMQTFAKQANAAAKSLGASTRDYTEASLIYYQQGLKDKEVKARTETTLKTANVTGQSTSTTSEELTSVWNGYKVAAKDTEKYIDKLAAVAADSASDLQELSTAMSKVASSANAMGVDVDSLNAQISTIISTTRQAPETVGTALKTIYARMGDLKADGTDEFGVSLGDITSQMQSMGVEILDENGKMRDMGKVIEEVGQKWQGWTREQKQAAAIAMAGKRQYNNLFALFENWDQYNKELKVSQSSLGTLQAQQDTYMDSMEAKQQKLTTQKEAFFSALWGDGKDVNNFTDALTELLSVATKFTESFGGGLTSLIASASVLAGIFKNQINRSLSQHFQNKNFESTQQGILQNKESFYNTRYNNIDSQEITEGQRDNNSPWGFYLNNERLSQGQAGEIEAFKKEKNIAKEIDKTRPLLSNEEYNNYIDKMSTIGDLTKQKYDIKEHNIDTKNKANEAFQKRLNRTDINPKKIANYNKEYQERINLLEQIKRKEEDITVEERDQIEKAKKYAGFDDKEQVNKEAILRALKEQKQELEKLVDGKKNIAALDKQIDAIENDITNELKERQAAQAKANVYTGIIQSMSLLTTAFGTLNSIFETLNDDDMSWGEKLVQILTSATMLIPMMISTTSALNKVNTQGLSLAWQDIKSIGTQIKLSVQKVLGLNAEAAAQEEVNAATLLFPGFWIVAAITAVVGVLTFFVQKNKESAEAIKEQREELVELGNTRQEEIDKINEANTAYEQAYQNYKKTGKGIDDLRDKQLELIDSLGDEGTALQSLMGDYEKFNEVAKDVTYRKLKKDEFDAETGLAAQGDLTLNNLQTDSAYDKNIKLGKVEVNFSSLNNIADVLKNYQDLGQIIQDYQAAGATQTEAYKEAFAMYGKVGAAIGDYTDQLEKVVDNQLALMFNQDNNQPKSQKDFEDQMNDQVKDWINNDSATDEEKKYVDSMIKQDKTLSKEDAYKKLYLQGIDANGSDAQKKYSQVYIQKQSTSTLIKNKLAHDFGADGYNNIIPSDEAIEAEDEKNKKYEKIKYRTWDSKGEKRFISSENGELDPTLKDILNNYDFENGTYAINNALSKSEFVPDGKTLTSWKKGNIQIDASSLDSNIRNLLKETGMSIDELINISKQDSLYPLQVRKNKTTNSPFVGENGNENIDKLSRLLNEEGGNKGKIVARSINSNKINLSKYTSPEEAYSDLMRQADDLILEFRSSFAEDKEQATQYANASGNLMSSVLSGDTTSSNIALNEDFKTIRDNTDNLKQAFPELIGFLDTINNTELTGTQDWLTALEAVQDKMEDLSNAAAAGELRNQVKDAIEYLNTENISFFFDDEEFQEKMKNIMDADYQIIVDIKAQMDQEFNNASGKLKNISDAASTIGKNFKVAQGDIKALGDTFPGILKNVTYLKDGSIRLNKEATKSAIESAKQEAKSTTQAAIADIKANQEKLKAKRAVYVELLKIVQKTNDNEVSQNQARAKIKKTLTNYEKILDKEVLDQKLEDITKLEEVETDTNQQAKDNYDKLAKSQVETSAKVAKAMAGNYQFGITGGKLGKLTETFDSSGPLEQNTTDQGGETKLIDSHAFDEYLTNTDSRKKLANKFQQQIKAIDNSLNSGDSSITALNGIYNGMEYGLDGASSGSGYNRDKNGKSKNDKKLDKIKDEFNNLENITAQLELQESFYDRISQLVEHTYGLQKVSLIEKENKNLKVQNRLLRDKGKLIQKNVEKEQGRLAGTFGAKFNKDGTISNHKKTWTKLKKQVNDAADKSDEKAYEKAKARFEKYQEWYSNLNDALKERADNQKSIDENLNKQVENNIAKLDVKLQVKVDIGDVNRALQDFRTEMAADTEYGLKANASLLKASSYQASSEIDEMINQSSRAMKAIDNMAKGRSDKIYKKDSVKAAERAKEEAEAAASAVKEMQSAVDEYWNTLTSYFKDITEQFDDIHTKLNNLVSDAKFASDYLKLLNPTDYSTQSGFDQEQGKLYLKDAQMYNNEQKEYAQSAEYWGQKRIEAEKAVAEAEASGDEGRISSAKKHLNHVKGQEKNVTDAMVKAEKNRQQAVLNATKSFQSAYTNQIDAIFKEVENKITNGYGYDMADKIWSMQKNTISSWYDDMERDFNIEDFKLSIDIDIDNESSEKVKKKLKEFQDEQITQLENQNNLSEYDIKLAKAKYDVLKKQMALEDARSRKNTLRLRRNSQGNYSYQYTADSSAINKAQQELNQSESNLYTTAKDRVTNRLDTVHSAMKEGFSTLQSYAKEKGMSMTADTTTEDIKTWLKNNGGEEYLDQWTKYMTGLQDDLAEAENDYAEVTYNISKKKTGELGKTWDKLSKDEKQRWINDTLPKIGTAFKDTYKGIGTDSESLKETLSTTINSCNTAITTYRQSISDLQAQAEASFPSINTTIETNKTKVGELEKTWSDTKTDYEAYVKLSTDSEKAQAMQDNIGALTSKVGELYTKLDNTLTKATNLKTTLSKLKNKTVTITTKKVTIDANSSGGGGGGSSSAVSSNNGGSNNKDNNKTPSSGPGVLEAGDIVQWTNPGKKNHDFLNLYKTPASLTAKGKEKKKNHLGKFFKPGAVGATENITDGQAQVVTVTDKAIQIKFTYYPDPNMWGGHRPAETQTAQGWITKKAFLARFSGYDTGGYTGNWNSKEGKLALLHEKEIVLNKEDTKNMFKILNEVRNIQTDNSLSNVVSKSIQSTLAKDAFLMQQIFSNSRAKTDYQKSDDVLQQTVTINADFPNAENAAEIEKAFNNLVNLATQQAYNKR